MKILRLITWALPSRAEDSEQEERLRAAREFVRSGEAKRMPLDEFERRFDITEIDHNSQIQGYPRSEYYRPEVPEEVERNHKAFEEFLATPSR